MPQIEKYIEVKWHGRVGQGVLPTAAALAEVMAGEGKYVQAFPDFNKEKNCIFVEAYNRLSDTPVKRHSAVEEADFIVIMDPALITYAPPVTKFPAKKNIAIIVNTPAGPQRIKDKLGLRDCRVYTLDADTIAREETGKINPIPNILLMAVLVDCLGWIPMEIFKQRLQPLLSPRYPADLASAYLNSVDRCVKEVRYGNGNES